MVKVTKLDIRIRNITTQDVYVKCNKVRTGRPVTSWKSTLWCHYIQQLAIGGASPSYST